MNDTIGGYDQELEDRLERQARFSKQYRPQPAPQLVEANDIKILGQDGGMLLIQLDLSIDKKPYVFIGPMQVVGEPKEEDPYKGITVLNIGLNKEME